MLSAMWSGGSRSVLVFFVSGALGFSACGVDHATSRGLPEANGGTAGTPAPAGCDVNGVHYESGQSFGPCNENICEDGDIQMLTILCTAAGGASDGGQGGEAAH